MNVERLGIYHLNGLTVVGRSTHPPGEGKMAILGTCHVRHFANPFLPASPNHQNAYVAIHGQRPRQRASTRQPAPRWQSKRHTPRQRRAPASVRRRPPEAGGGARAPGNPRVAGPATDIRRRRSKHNTRYSKRRKGQKKAGSEEPVHRKMRRFPRDERLSSWCSRVGPKIAVLVARAGCRSRSLRVE